MTKKDYIIFAKLINDWIVKTQEGELQLIRRHSAYPSANNFIEAFADELKKDNPRFDKQRFLNASGIKQ